MVFNLNSLTNHLHWVCKNALYKCLHRSGSGKSRKNSLSNVAMSCGQTSGSNVVTPPLSKSSLNCKDFSLSLDIYLSGFYFIFTCRTRFLEVLTLNIPTVLKPFSSRYFVQANTIEGTCWSWLWTPGIFDECSSSSSWLLLRSILVWKRGKNVLCKYSASALAGRDSHEPELSRCWWSSNELSELRELLVSFLSFDRFWSFSMHCSSGKLNTKPPKIFFIRWCST